MQPCATSGERATVTVRFIQSRHQDADNCGMVCRSPLHEIMAAHRLHHDIRENYVNGLAGKYRYGFSGVRGCPDLVSGIGKRYRDHAPDRLFVVNNEDSGHPFSRENKDVKQTAVNALALPPYRLRCLSGNSQSERHQLL
jgi:hypothetical protein